MHTYMHMYYVRYITNAHIQDTYSFILICTQIGIFILIHYQTVIGKTIPKLYMS